MSKTLGRTLKVYPTDLVRKDHLQGDLSGETRRYDTMTATIEDLKAAAELLERAVELIREVAKETSLPSVAERRSMGEEIVKIRLKLMLMRRDLTLLHATANRRKPRKPQTNQS